MEHKSWKKAPSMGTLLNFHALLALLVLFSSDLAGVVPNIILMLRLGPRPFCPQPG